MFGAAAIAGTAAAPAATPAISLAGDDAVDQRVEPVEPAHGNPQRGSSWCRPWRLIGCVGVPAKPARFFGSAEQSPRLVDAFLLLGGGIAIRDDAGAGLHVHGAVLDQRGAQGDAGVHVAVGVEITDARRHRCRGGRVPSSSMICIARTFGAPETVPAGKPATRASSASYFGSSSPSTLETMCMTWL